MAQENVILLLPPTLDAPPFSLYLRFQITSPSATWSWPFESARDCASYFSSYTSSLPHAFFLFPFCFSTSVCLAALFYIFSVSIWKVTLLKIQPELIFRQNYFAESNGIFYRMLLDFQFNFSYITYSRSFFKLAVPENSELRKTEHWLTSRFAFSEGEGKTSLIVKFGVSQEVPSSPFALVLS